MDTEQRIALLEERITELENKAATRIYVQTYIEQILGDMMPIHDPFTENSPIAGYEVLQMDTLMKHFVNLGSSYTLYDYRSIITSYETTAKIGNINPYIAIAQMVKETDWCRSWWSQRPRRNPAGLGVTGEETTKEPANKNVWSYSNDSHVWKKGYSFPSWQVSTQAHIGHLLAYMHKQDDLTEEQQYLVASDPRSAFIAPSIRGTVKLLKHLDGKWAVPGVGYGRSIATLANVLRM